MAKLAGVPDVVLERAKEILKGLLSDDTKDKAKGIEVNPTIGEAQAVQMSLFDQLLAAPEHPVVEELRNLDLSRTTPIEALNLLYQLQEKAKKQ